MTRLGEISPYSYSLDGHWQFSLELAVFDMVCCTYFNFQKQFDAIIIFTFNLSFDILVTVLVTFQKIGDFFPSSWNFSIPGTIAEVKWSVLLTS